MQASNSSPLAPRPSGMIPESPETLAEQVQMLIDGKRQAVLVTWGAPLPDLPIGVEAMPIDCGMLIYNPEHLNRRLIMAAVRSDELGDLLGYGAPRKPAAPTGSVTLRNANGEEKQSVLVDGATRTAALQAAEHAKSPGDSVTEEEISSVLADRVRSLTDRDLKLYPVESQAMARRVEAAARADGNHTTAPTHYWERNGEIVGALGLTVLPLARIWLHKDRVRAHDSLDAVRALSASLSMAGHRVVAVVINADSPFLKVKERFGFVSNPGDVIALKAL